MTHLKFCAARGAVATARPSRLIDQTLRVAASAGIVLTGVAWAMGAAGCEDREAIRVYHVEADEAHDPHAGHDHAAEAPALAETPVRPREADSAEPWVAPANWRRVPDERPMRVATFAAGEGESLLEIVVSQFPGDVGGVLANVNRWRGQVGLPPVAEGDLDALLTPFENTGFAGHTMRLEGPESHMLAAIIREDAADRTWFVKAVGPPEIADQHEEQVFAFARSFGTASREPGGEQ